MTEGHSHSAHFNVGKVELTKPMHNIGINKAQSESIHMTRQDRALNTAFGQIELLETLAIAGGDTILATDLRNAMTAALERYCAHQWARLEVELLVKGPA